MSRSYYRPLVQTGPMRPAGAVPLAGGWAWFERVELLRRDGPSEVIEASALPEAAFAALSHPRPPVCGLDMARPRLMGILNVTPDSFSDGGRFLGRDAAVTQGRALIAAGADILDIGGESTRPGAVTVPDADEAARVVPVIGALAGQVPISIDTRKASVAQAALEAGAGLVNDVAALSYDAAMAGVVAAAHVPVCLMHAQGDPATMQENPTYDNVLLDVYDYLSGAVDRAVAAGIARHDIIVDPGIGFGKTLAHNLALLARLSLFHGLGCPLLLGASRKRFIGTLTGDAPADRRMPGSLAVALAGIAQGAQILRVHDMEETAQALTLWQAAKSGEAPQ